MTKMALIFVFAFGLFLPSGLVQLGIYDEGFIVTGAKMVMAGHLPYRDFLSFYGPAQYYLVGALYALAGENLLVSRIAHVATVAALLPAVFLLSSAAAGEPRAFMPYAIASICLAVGLTCRPSANYPAIPATLFLLIAALFVGRWSLGPPVRDLLLASAAIGITALFRWDFGLLGLIAAGGSVILLRAATRAATPPRRFFVAAIGPGIAIMVVAYLPLLAASGPAHWYQEIIRYSLFEFEDYRGIEFVRPTYWKFRASLRDGDVLEFYDALFGGLFLAGPLVLSVTTMAIAATRIRRRTNDSAATRALVQSVFLALVDLALLNQMRVRPDLWHGMPAAVASLPLLAFLLGAYGLGGVASSSRQVVQRILALVAAPVVITTGLAGFLWSVSSTVHVPLSIPRATAIRDNPANQYYRELVSYVIEMTSPDESIYSGVSDHTRLFVNDALLYFLSNRSSATRFIQMDPGIANTESAQKAIRDTLEQRRVRMVVLLDIQSGEANLSSRSNGVHLLDRFIRERYWETRRFGPYRVMELE